MRIMIFGGTGQLGQDCIRELGRKYDLASLSSKEADITGKEDVYAAVRSFQPQVVINCAAYTRVDDCETEKDKAFAVNAAGPRHLAEAAREHNSLLVHISTDYVFDGRKPLTEAYEENDKTTPLSVYGQSKLAGEKAVITSGCRYIICRTAWVYGIDGNNFLKAILKKALAYPGQELMVVNDQYGSPTGSHRLAKQIRKLIESGGQGLYHATAEGRTTWYDLAVFFLKAMSVPHRIRACSSSEYQTPATRPKNAVLENHRLKIEQVNVMRDWREDVAWFVSRYRDQLLKELK